MTSPSFADLSFACRFTGSVYPTQVVLSFTAVAFAGSVAFRSCAARRYTKVVTLLELVSAFNLAQGTDAPQL